MSTPISRRHMLRLLLVAALDDVPAPQMIRFWGAGETGSEPTVSLEVGTTAAAREWSTALGLSDPCETGQPWPLTAPKPETWSGALVGELGGWAVHLAIEEPYTDEHEARWVAKGGLRAHPRTAPIDAGEVPDA